MKRKRLVAVSAAVVALLALWTLYWEPSSFRLHRDRLTLSGWPPEQSGLRIALLSDLHMGSPWNDPRRLEEVVARVNQAEPHLVLLAGDYVIGNMPGGKFIPPEETAMILKELRAPLGVYAVLGNHDWWFDGPRVEKAFDSSGLVVLEDRSVHIQEGRFDFWLVGLSDIWTRRSDVDSVLASVPPSTSILAFTHNPDVFPRVPPRVALTLAGHTHGGQVKFPFFGTPVVPSQFGDRYVRGWVVEGGRSLYVTSGLGTSILPVRFRVPPEAALLELVGREATD